MKARIGNNEFDATGDDQAVADAFQQWLVVIKRQERAPIEARIVELEAELEGLRWRLKRFDEPAVLPSQEK